VNEKIQEEEISNGKEQLEKITGKSVDFIAYPYGIFNEVTKSISENQGYRAGFTTNTAPLQKGRDAFSLGRMMVDEEMDFRRLIR
jgi:peptidoglycan/xylan/chitin deacetylase (PgdA/CDA1 family)